MQVDQNLHARGMGTLCERDSVGLAVRSCSPDSDPSELETVLGEDSLKRLLRSIVGVRDALGLQQWQGRKVSSIERQRLSCDLADRQ